MYCKTVDYWSYLTVPYICYACAVRESLLQVAQAGGMDWHDVGTELSNSQCLQY